MPAITSGSINTCFILPFLFFKISLNFSKVNFLSNGSGPKILKSFEFNKSSVFCSSTFANFLASESAIICPSSNKNIKCKNLLYGSFNGPFSDGSHLPSAICHLPTSRCPVIFWCTKREYPPDKSKIIFLARRQIFNIFLPFICFLKSLNNFGFLIVFSQSDHTSTKALFRTFDFKPLTVVSTSGNSVILYKILSWLFYFSYFAY